MLIHHLYSDNDMIQYNFETTKNINSIKHQITMITLMKIKMQKN